MTGAIKPHFAIFRELNWETSDPQVALVSENGLVTAVDAGTAAITVSARAGEKVAVCRVRVFGPELLSRGNGLYDGEQQDEMSFTGQWESDQAITEFDGGSYKGDLKNGIPKTVFSSNGQYVYPDRNVSYYFDEGIVFQIGMSGSREILGIQIGEMNFSAVEETLRPPDWRSICEEYCYEMCLEDSLRYYLGDYKENCEELELELYTYRGREGAPVRSVRVTWNRYYSW